MFSAILRPTQRILRIWLDIWSLCVLKRSSEGCPVMKLKYLTKTGGLAPYRFRSKTEVSGMALATGDCRHK